MQFSLSDQERTHRRNGPGHPQRGDGRRGLPATHHDSRNRPGNRDRSVGCDRQRNCVSKRARSVGMGRDGTPRILYGRQTEAARHQQTGQLVFATTVRARGTHRDAASDQAGPRATLLVRSTAGPHPSECGNCGAGEQVGSHRMGGIAEERNISMSCSTHLKL
jgi:hypothetical protein